MAAFRVTALRTLSSTTVKLLTSRAVTCGSAIRCHSEDGKKASTRGKTPEGRLDDPFDIPVEERNPVLEKEPLEKFPNNTNPTTGEIGGPRGPEPTRYGDWERKGRVSDF